MTGIEDLGPVALAVQGDFPSQMSKVKDLTLN
jgi:hypothetical protein